MPYIAAEGPRDIGIMLFCDAELVEEFAVEELCISVLNWDVV